MSIRLLPDGTLEFETASDLLAYQGTQAPAEPKPAPAPDPAPVPGPGKSVVVPIGAKAQKQTHYVTQSEHDVLMVLREFKGEEMRSAELTELSGADLNTTSRNVNRLINGVPGRPPLVERMGRSRKYRITALGLTATLVVEAKPKCRYVG